jgi:hypothetical protein
VNRTQPDAMTRVQDQRQQLHHQQDTRAGRRGSMSDSKPEREGGGKGTWREDGGKGGEQGK